MAQKRIFTIYHYAMYHCYGVWHGQVPAMNLESNLPNVQAQARKRMDLGTAKHVYLIPTPPRVCYVIAKMLLIHFSSFHCN